MNNEDIINYIIDTPDNTNPNVLKDMLNSSSGFKFETGIYVPTGSTSSTSPDIRPTILFSNIHEEAPVMCIMYDTTNSAYQGSGPTEACCEVIDYYKLFGAPLYLSSSTVLYGMAYYINGSSSNVQVGGFKPLTYYDMHPTDLADIRYWMDKNAFYPYAYNQKSTNRFWRVGRTYKWIAIWKS